MIHIILLLFEQPSWPRGDIVTRVIRDVVIIVTFNTLIKIFVYRLYNYP